MDEPGGRPSNLAKPLRELLFPDRNADFHHLMDRLSQPETGPPADNLMTNEDSFTRVSEQLERLTPPNTVYLGVGPDQNFTLIAHCKPTLSFILDFRRKNQLLHLLHKALFVLARDRQTYLSMLTARSPIDPSKPFAEAFASVPMDRERLKVATSEVYAYLQSLNVRLNDRDRQTLETIHARLAGPGVECRFLALKIYPTLAKLMAQPGHVLNSEAHYQTVLTLQRADRMIPIVGDYGAQDGFTPIANWLKDHGLRVGAVYVSDVEFFLLRNGRLGWYAENLKALPRHEDAIIVRTSTREIEHPDRVAGDSSTTIVRRITPFLADVKAGTIRSVDDLFRAGGG